MCREVFWSLDHDSLMRELDNLYKYYLIIKIYFDRSFVRFLCKFLRFEVLLTSEDILRGYHDVTKGHSQKVKIRTKIARKRDQV